MFQLNLFSTFSHEIDRNVGKLNTKRAFMQRRLGFKNTKNSRFTLFYFVEV
jgi:hypothetical protein